MREWEYDMKKILKIKKVLNAKIFVAFAILVSILCFSSSCKKQNYMPKQDNAFLASLKFSEGLKVEEEFDKNTFDYNLNIKKQQQKQVQSQLGGFFVICIPDNPASICKVSINGKVKVKELDKELPFHKELPIPFVPLKLKLKTSTLFPNLPSIPSVPGTSKNVEVVNNLVCSLNFLLDSSEPSTPNNPDLPNPPIDPNNPNLPNPPIDPNNPNLPKLPFDPNDPSLPELPIDPNDPNFPKIPDNIPNLPEYISIELANFDLTIVVRSPDNSERMYTVHGKVVEN